MNLACVLISGWLIAKNNLSDKFHESSALSAHVGLS
jgi:hypothetical protein